MRLASRSTIRVPMMVTALAVIPAVTAAQQPSGARDSVRSAPAPYTLAGVVRDTTGQPLRAAEVRAGQRAAITDSLGRFRIDGLVDNPTHLLVRRIGYSLVETSIDRQPDVQRVEIAVHMRANAVQLGTVVVNERRVPVALLKTGYLERKRLGTGKFFDGEELDRLGSSYTSVLGAVPGVEISFGKFGAIHALGRPLSGIAMGSKCTMDVYLDGTLISWARETGLDWVLPKNELMAIEVYPRAGQVPAAAARMGRPGGSQACGAIFLWSKPFEPKKESEEGDRRD